MMREYIKPGMMLANTVHETMLPGLIYPLFDPQRQPEITREYAKEFSGAFVRALALEGDRAARFVLALPEEQRNRVFQVLIRGGAGGIVYASHDIEFEVPQNYE